MSAVPRSLADREMLSSHGLLPVYAAAAACALLAGMVSGTGRPGLIALFFAGIAALVLASSRKALLWAVVAGGIVVTGLTQLYLPEARIVKFVVPLISLLLLVYALMDMLAGRPDVLPKTMPGMVTWMLVFTGIAAVTTLVNWDPGVALLGFKGYFTLWTLVFALLLSRWRVADLDGLLKLMLGIALLQIPFVMHQYLVLVPLREGLGPGVIPVDILVGTFGGNALGGGANAVLALFSFVVFACLLGLWRHGAVSGVVAFSLGLPIIAPVFFNEAKIAVFYLPVVVLLVFWQDLALRPLRFLAVGGAAAILFGLLMTAMTVFHPGGNLRTWSDLINVTWEQQVADIEDLRGQHSELTRWTALTFWAQEHARAHPLHVAVGHGIGASRVAEEGEWSVTRTLAEERYHAGLRIGYTAISSILWDTGVLGLIAIVGGLISAWRTAGRLALEHAGVDPFHAGIFDGLKAGIAIVALSLAHKDFFVLHLPYQTLVLLMLGYLALAARRSAEGRS
ncbi:MAG: hypothetical protein RBT81_06570 [Gammaproteobacteria bacterium]|jgi:hypothetical protein|nr:hypothetical protein [Gammaproteobacteria bacterium]